MAWAKPQHGKGRVDWAGDLIANEEDWFNPDVVLAQEIVNNWRAIRSYPLQAMKMTLKRRAKRICPSAIVAQRLKRLASIKLKLRVSSASGNHPKLSQMQDIGGCRAVMDCVAQVRSLEQAFEEASRKNPHRGPQYSKTYDYLNNPKPNGYRGVHLVYRYRTTSTEHDCYNGQRIEIQLRSKLQHYWATAVETYSTFTGEALKSNIGSDSWKRFFALMSSVMAIQEGTPVVADTFATLEELVPELRSLFYSLNVDNVLSGWTAVTRHTETGQELAAEGAAMYLLVLDPDKFQINIRPYKASELSEADAEYARMKRSRNFRRCWSLWIHSQRCALLILTTSSSTTAFLDEVRKVVSSDGI